jgi:hypothetical protein
MVKFQQRYQKRNRILSKAVPAWEFCSSVIAAKWVNLPTRKDREPNQLQKKPGTQKNAEIKTEMQLSRKEE